MKHIPRALSCLLIFAAISGLSLSLSLLGGERGFIFCRTKLLSIKRRRGMATVSVRGGPSALLWSSRGGRRVVGVRSHLLRHCRDGHWMGAEAWPPARMGMGLRSPADFIPIPFFGRCSPLLCSSLRPFCRCRFPFFVASLITPIFFLLLVGKN